MRVPVLSALFSLFASGVMALSCMPHDPATVYQDAAKSDQRYFVILGELTFDASRLPKTDWNNQADTPPETRIPARLDGKSLGPGGFHTRFDGQVTLNAQCYGPWCAGAVSGARYLAFVNADNRELVISPCGGFGFAEPSQQTIDTMLHCHRGAACESVHR